MLFLKVELLPFIALITIENVRVLLYFYAENLCFLVKGALFIL